MRLSSQSRLGTLGWVLALLCLPTCQAVAAPIDSVLPESRQIREAALDLREALDSGRFEFHMGTLSPDAPASLRIGIHNCGDEPIRFTDSRSSCGCTSAGLPTEPIEAGASEVIELGFDLHNRQGEFRSSVVFELSVGDAADPELVVGTISANLERDVWLSTDNLDLLFSPSDLMTTDHIRSPSVGIHVDDSLRDVGDGYVCFEPRGELPTGVSVQWSGSGDEDSLRFYLRVDSGSVPDLPPSFTVPIVVHGLDSKGQEMFSAVRDLHVRVGPRHAWVVEPSDPLLGVFSADELPEDRSIDLSLNPITGFRVQEPSGTVDGLDWQARPDSAIGPMATTWRIDLRLTDSSVGIHSAEISIPIAYRVGVQTHEQAIVLHLQYMVI